MIKLYFASLQRWHWPLAIAQRRPSSLSLMNYWQVEHTLSINHKSYFPGAHLLLSLRLCWQPAHTQLLPLSTPTALSGQACCQRPQLWWRLQGYRSRAEAVSEERLNCAETVSLLLLLVEPNPGVQQHIKIARPHLTEDGGAAPVRFQHLQHHQLPPQPRRPGAHIQHEDYRQSC